MIDFMRVVYSLVIVMLHSVYLTTEKTRYLFPNGYLAVEAFFIISGFLMFAEANECSRGGRWIGAKKLQNF